MKFTHEKTVSTLGEIYSELDTVFIGRKFQLDFLPYF